MLNNFSNVSNLMEAKRGLLPSIDQLIKSDVEWEKSKSEYDKQKKELLEKLGKEEVDQLLDMEDKKTNMSNRELETMYYKGIEDAIEILKGLKII